MKKSIFYITQSVAIGLAFACTQLMGQTNVNMANNGTAPGSPFNIAPPATCFFNFYDSGGPGANYNNNADANITFVPSDPTTHRIQVSFNAFALEVGYDALYIYNSNAVGVNQIPGPQGPTISGFPGNNWQNISPGTITANTGIAAVGANADEALTFRFRSDVAITTAGWSAIVRQVPKINCTMTAPMNIATTTGVNATSCSRDVTTPLPTFSPGGCQAGYQLQYRINGGAPTAVFDPVNTTISIPVGANVVTWELIDPCGGGVITSAVQLITLTDNAPPTLTCPTNSTITLPPGECNVLNYNPSVLVMDNCPFGNSGQVNHPIDFNNGNSGIMFDLTNLGATPITITNFGPSLSPGTWTMEVYYTTAAVSFNGLQNTPGAWTLAGTQVVMPVSSAVGTHVPGFGITIPAGQTRGIYLTTTGIGGLNYTEGARQISDGTLRVSSTPGAGVSYPFGNSFFNRSYNGFVEYSTPAPGAAVQIGGPALPLTSPLAHGNTYTFTFQGTDAAGNSTICSWNLTVQDFPNPTTNMTCNDLVNLALGPGCEGCLTADEVLEGGPFRCYEYYPVQVDKTPPFGNGPWVPACFDATDIGNTYRWRVFYDQNQNGIMDANEIRCFGDVKIQDAIPPQLNCNPIPITIPFNFPLDPMFSQVATMELPFRSQGLPLTVVNGQTREFELPVNLPMNATVNDVELRVKISGDAFLAGLNIEIEDPTGSTVVTTWNGGAGCDPLPLFVRFDDEGTPVLACDSYTTDKRAQIPFGFSTLSSFDGLDVNGIWKVRITDPLGGFPGTVSLIEIADLYITMTGVFSAGFPNGLSAPPVSQIGNQTYLVPRAAACAAGLDCCSDVTLSYVDFTQNQLCPTGLTAIVTRRWTATDGTGNTSTCNQILHLQRPSLTDVMFPPNYDDIQQPAFYDCNGEYPSPDWLEANGFQGYPYTFGMPTGGSVFWEHHDTPIWICDGSYTISRLWTAIDACTGQSLTHIQLINVFDVEGPMFLTPVPDMDVSTNPYSCCGSMLLPSVIVQDKDDCSRINSIVAYVTTFDMMTGDTLNVIAVNGSLVNFPGNLPFLKDTMATFGQLPCIPIGKHVVTYVARDDCGNTGTLTFNLTVADYTPPVAACDETTIVAIGVDDPNDCYYADFGACEFGGITWVRATSFDDGSYDQCSNIRFTVRRAAPYGDCITSLNQCEFLTATAELDSIKFYCCEVGTEVKVILRVYQINPDGSVSTLPDGTLIFNECEVKVQVQDKLRPVCISPLNATVSCENFDPSLWAYGLPTVYDNCCLDTTKMFMGQKGLQHSVNYAQFDSVCNRGTIVRTFRVTDCHGATMSCTQRIVVNYSQNYFIKFPDDGIVNVCDGTGMFGQPQFFGEDCELLGVSYTDQIFTVVPDACFKIERTWKIINWCTYNPDLGCIYVPNPNPNAISNHASNLPGPTVSPLGTPAPWAPTVVKVLPSDVNTTNYSIYWNANANCYEYKQIIKIIDQVGPIMVCPPSPQEFCDLTDNSPQLWNEQYWFDPVRQSNDLCEAPVDLNISATDFCSGSNVNIRYLLFLDLDGDGTMETVVSSTTPPTAGNVNYNNANTPNFGGGTPRQFDKRAVPVNQKYRFALQTTVNGNSLSASVRWNTATAQNTYAIPELPYGRHKIKWFASDGCGNESVCEYEFIVKDCKSPTVVCINGLSGNLMQAGMITIYASDFLLHAFDNCTPADYLVYALRKCGTGSNFPLDQNGNPNISLTFDCNEIGTQCVELWAMDLAGNADFCETYIIVQDNANNCSSGGVSVAGLLKTEMGDGLEETDVELSGPSFNLFQMSNQDGHYAFNNAVPMHSNYTVIPHKDDNPLNGVTTYDLVLISKHILGIEPFDSPYKMIAADANKSGSITTFDIVELRKLILGIYTELPNSVSWRFVDKSFVFPNPANPFQTGFPETKTVADIAAHAMGDDFVAVKIGDVNNTAMANSLMVSDDRSSSTLIFDVEDRRVKAGEVFEVNFKAAELVAGYQFTLNHTDLELADIIPGPGMKPEHFALFPEASAMTTSFDGAQQGSFSLKFRAKRNGELSKMISVSSRITKAEGYQINNGTTAEPNGEVNRMDIALRFNSKEGSTISGVGFELYQNQPNPFVNYTLVGFHLPEATSATLSIFDESSRLVYRQKADFPKGYNSITLDRALLNTSGTLFYTLETETDSATKTMIQIK